MKERLPRGAWVAKEIISIVNTPIVKSLAALGAPSGLSVAVVKESIPAIIAFGTATVIIYLPIIYNGLRKDKRNSQEE